MVPRNKKALPATGRAFFFLCNWHLGVDLGVGLSGLGIGSTLNGGGGVSLGGALVGGDVLNSGGLLSGLLIVVGLASGETEHTGDGQSE